MRHFICKKCEKKHEKALDAIQCCYWSIYKNKYLLPGDLIFLKGYMNYFNGDPLLIAKHKFSNIQLVFTVMELITNEEGRIIAHIMTNAYYENCCDIYIPLDLLPRGEKIN